MVQSVSNELHIIAADPEGNYDEIKRLIEEEPAPLHKPAICDNLYYHK